MIIYLSLRVIIMNTKNLLAFFITLYSAFSVSADDSMAQAFYIVPFSTATLLPRNFSKSQISQCSKMLYEEPLIKWR